MRRNLHHQVGVGGVLTLPVLMSQGRWEQRMMLTNEEAKRWVEMWLAQHPNVVCEGQDREHLENVLWFAANVKLADNLLRALDQAAFPTFFGKPCRIVLMKDFAWMSFYFVIMGAESKSTDPCWMNGGVIFHRNYGEGKDEVTDGSWSVHT